MSRRDDATACGPSDLARAEAAAWIARLHGPHRSQEMEAGLHRWLADSVENAQAFERMTEAWNNATSLAAGHFPRLQVWKPPAPRIWARAAAVLLVCGVGGAFITSSRWNASAYVTGIGEQRTVRLDDGSRLSLNSGSRVVVEYSDSKRSLRLERGEAFFEVSPDAQRLFIVSAGERRVIALGTSFSVRYEPDRLAVTLLEGKVRVYQDAVRGMPASLRPAAGNAAASNKYSESEAAGQTLASPRIFTLSPGERLILAGSRPPKLDAPPVDSVTAWRRGEVILQKTTLADAVKEMNRYDKTRLIVDESAISGLLISGIYRAGDSAGFARAMEAVHGVETVQRGETIHLREGKATVP